MFRLSGPGNISIRYNVSHALSKGGKFFKVISKTIVLGSRVILKSEVPENILITFL